jgi:G3E family GTPase
MSNGCICCTLREDLMIEVERLAKENRFDYLLIESTGISEPLPVAQTFSFVDEEKGIDLSRFSILDTMVTVVDAYNFSKDFGSAETIKSMGLNDDEKDTRAIVNLLTDQIEFANVIIINKTDLVSAETLGELKAILKRLNPSATIINSSFGKVPLNKLLNTQSFNFEEASQSPLWQEELQKEHTPETEEYGITSFVFKEKRPFHPQRFLDYVNYGFPSSVIRSKGLFWMASRPNDAINWSQAGGSLRAEPAGVWWASMKLSERMKYADFVTHQKDIESRWDKKFGDRINELVIIGQNLNKEQIISELEDCICTDSEIIMMNNGHEFEDEWPI